MHHRNSKSKLSLLLIRKCITFLFLILLLFACTSKKQSEFTLVGRWKTDKDGTISQMSDSKRHNYESKPEEVREVLKKSLDGRFYEFKADGTVIFSISRNGKTNSFVGAWKYNADSAKLITTSEKGIDTRFTVSTDSPDKVVLKNEKADNRSMLDDWVLQRIKN